MTTQEIYTLTDEQLDLVAGAQPVYPHIEGYRSCSNGLVPEYSTCPEDRPTVLDRIRTAIEILNKATGK